MCVLESKLLLLDAISDLAFDEPFGQMETGAEHPYVVDFNNSFMLIGLVGVPRGFGSGRHLLIMQQQNTFSWLLPFIPYLPSRTLRNAQEGLERIFTYSQQKVQAYLSADKEKAGTFMSAYLDEESGQPKHPYTAWDIALAGHGFVYVFVAPCTFTSCSPLLT
jgi:hypothetical protein